VVFLFRFLAICGKGEPALCGGRWSRDRFGVDACEFAEGERKKQTHIDGRRTECRGGYYVPIYTKDRE